MDHYQAHNKSCNCHSYFLVKRYEELEGEREEKGVELRLWIKDSLLMRITWNMAWPRRITSFCERVNSIRGTCNLKLRTISHSCPSVVSSLAADSTKYLSKTQTIQVPSFFVSLIISLCSLPSSRSSLLNCISPSTKHTTESLRARNVYSNTSRVV